MKQEALEAAAENYADHQLKGIPDKISKFECINDFKAGAKWQQEQSYNEEEVLELLFKSEEYTSRFNGRTNLKHWFEQFKKK